MARLVHTHDSASRRMVCGNETFTVNLRPHVLV